MPTVFFLIVMCILFNIGHGSTYISYLRIEQAKRLLIKGMLSFLVSGFCIYRLDVCRYCVDGRFFFNRIYTSIRHWYIVVGNRRGGHKALPSVSKREDTRPCPTSRLPRTSRPPTRPSQCSALTHRFSIPMTRPSRHVPSR